LIFSLICLQCVGVILDKTKCRWN